MEEQKRNNAYSSTPPSTGAHSIPATATTESRTPQEPKKVQGSLAGGTWLALIFGALLLIVLLIFIMQNQESVQLEFFGWNFNFPLGVGLLLSAIAGALIMAMVGAVRMFQLRKQIKKSS
ncbi:LapA family protein [Corynebacterium gerontici]|uniref:Lipopolysaccharide assembly protein A domain-containing protein n=1 Tax=Corynebacterium gerontici TaxID=2079234 RepID=A0A3G6J178_9CORY|nr:lipopolysaccharide assembly protein LapA domain-containing protein [Corynebacterium gerontici]AZA11676.1 hypothetical protein CGERO_06880 [Corynebacterium gerontici]